MEAYVSLTIENKVGFIEFFHPNRNSMPSTILSNLEQTIVDAGNDDAIKVIVLKSNGVEAINGGGWMSLNSKL